MGEYFDLQRGDPLELTPRKEIWSTAPELGMMIICTKSSGSTKNMKHQEELFKPEQDLRQAGFVLLWVKHPPWVYVCELWLHLLVFAKTVWTYWKQQFLHICWGLGGQLIIFCLFYIFCEKQYFLSMGSIMILDQTSGLGRIVRIMSMQGGTTRVHAIFPSKLNMI